MASFKADSRYTRRVDVDDAQTDSHSDEHSDNEEIPRHLVRERKLWLHLYEEELDDIFASYIAIGRRMFGLSFHQNGGPREFANFVFKFMQSGAN